MASTGQEMKATDQPQPLNCQEDMTVQQPQDVQVKIIVGTGMYQETFLRSKTKLIAESRFFAACFRSGMVEEQQSEVKFPEDSPWIFEILLHFADNLHCPHPFQYRYCFRPCCVIHAKDNGGLDKLSVFLDTYCIAEKYGFRNVQNAITDGIISLSTKEGLPPYMYSRAVDYVEPTSYLYKVIQDGLIHSLVHAPELYSNQHDKELLIGEGDGGRVPSLSEMGEYREAATRYTRELCELWDVGKFDSDFSRRFMAAVLNKGAETPLDQRRCDYHDHEDGSACPVDEGK
ncbi:hypothetical protein H2200_007987 [Cladophialophora chaetospira]|uniref:BTB domain-containing protein n=1 Tax=Cladophialophora chaetospira TaxID=386627 RepID=A0AA38X6X8_9EURO|nr:hypothetical protein H2200_007987 [Cladophialophora chaetospira]